MLCQVESINIHRGILLNRVQFTNMLQLKIIEEHYGLSSLYQPEEFNEAFMNFVSNKGPQKLRNLLDKHEDLVEYHYKEDKPWTHNEMVFLSRKIFKGLQGE